MKIIRISATLIPAYRQAGLDQDSLAYSQKNYSKDFGK